jgi:glutaredoxin
MNGNTAFLRLCLSLLGLALSAAAFAEDIHKWVDKDGNVHFGDRPPENVRTQVITVKPNVYTTTSVESLNASMQASETIVMYSASWCGFCKKARNHFQSKNIPFLEYDVETSAKGRDDFVRLRANSVPVILVGKKRLNGFTPAAFDRLYASRK